MFKRFLQEEEGQTLVEYGLIISLLALISALALTHPTYGLGSKIRRTFEASINQFNTSNIK